VSRRTAGVLAAIYSVAVLGFVWVMAGPAIGGLATGAAVAFVVLFLGGYSWCFRAAERRRERALAPTRPGWTFQPALTTSSQIAAMRATGARAVVGAQVTLGWGADGLGMWATRHRQATTVLTYTWAQVADVAETTELRTTRGVASPGIRIRLVDGTTQDLRTAADRALRAAHPDATPAGAVALDIMDTRAASTRA
jgi:putative flippase GtrA